MKTTIQLQRPEPLGVSSKSARALFGSPAVLKNAVKNGEIKPVIKGGRGKTAIYDLKDLQTYWRSLKGESGYSMVELLGVVAVLAIITTIAILSISGTVSTAKETAILTNLQNYNSTWANVKALDIEWGWGGQPGEWDAPTLVQAFGHSYRDPELGTRLGPFLPGIADGSELQRMADAGYPPDTAYDNTTGLVKASNGIVIAGYLNRGKPGFENAWYNLVQTPDRGFHYSGWNGPTQVTIP